MNKKRIGAILIIIMLIAISFGALWSYHYKLREYQGILYALEISQQNSTKYKLINGSYVVWLPFPEDNGKPCSDLINEIIVYNGTGTFSIENTEKGMALKIIITNYVIFGTKKELWNDTKYSTTGLTMKIGEKHQDTAQYWVKIERTNNTTSVYFNGLFAYYHDLTHTNIFGHEIKDGHGQQTELVGLCNNDQWNEIDVLEH